VIVAALDSTFERKPFDCVSRLFCLCEDVQKLRAICQICGEEAAFTERISDETEVEVIGGLEKYRAVCRQCYKGGRLAKSVANDISF